MNEQNNGRKRKVSRQNWKPNGWLKFFYGLWTAFYTCIKIALAALATVVVIVGVCVVVFVGLLGQYLEGEIIPKAGVQIESFDLDQTSYVYYIDDAGNPQRLQRIYAANASEWATIDEIPEDLIHAAVAIEDKRFFEHQGVDWFTTVKACINMFVGSGDQFGGSSITQQLIKNMLLLEDEAADDVTVQRKILEIFRATQFERRYDKNVVMEYYLNYIYLGSRCTGVKSAAAKYFGKELEHLNAAECAALISITNNPSLYNPYRTNLDGEGKTGLEQNKERMTNTLWVMRNEGWLTEEEYQEALNQEIVLKDGIDEADRIGDCPNEECGYHDKVGTFDKRDDGKYYCPVCGTLTTIGEDASQEVYSWFVDTVLEDVAKSLAEQGGLAWNKETKELYMNLIGRGGYHIYTTLDIKAQTCVDNIYNDLSQIPPTHSVQQLLSAIVIIDNATGDIVAMAGGVGEKGFDDWNCATDAKLQPGSSLKPITIYGPAFEMGIISPATVIKDMPIRYFEKEDEEVPPGEEPTLIAFPKNDSKQYNYSLTVRDGLISSVNGIAVNTLDKIGLTYSYQFAKEKFRISTLTDRFVNSAGTVFSDIDWSPLGMGAPTHGVTVRDMASAYATFANNGVWRSGRTWLKVYNSDGKMVLDNPQESEKILSENAVNYLNYCLDSAVAYGTGMEADIPGQDVCGKTGTTSSRKDRWFCGYTDYYTAAVWSGYKTPEEIKTVYGGNPSSQLFKKVMQPLHQGLSRIPLYSDENFETVTICLDSGKLATAACGHDVRSETLSRITNATAYGYDLPNQTCDKHVMVECCGSGKGVASEYCKNFAAVGQTTLVRKGLLKVTEQELEAIIAAKDNGLLPDYCRDDYIYLVDADGRPVPFFGIDEENPINEDLEVPYLVCTEHTKEAWEEYLNTRPGVDDPTEPTDPALPTEPGKPDEDEDN